MGNSWVTTLPKGTKIIVKDPAALASAFNEIKDGVLVEPCLLVSPSYLDSRDRKELEQLYLIEELKARKDVP